ncbi:MAG: type II toxin-antitoxin system Phd/YefM family antitoxin [Elusimicrobia bacterium]|nr:type II toxin-antitoxin system Phd/YefM family antitoxin [Elusimicrobiota bacterium]
MRVIKEKSAFAAISELRTHLDEVLNQIKQTPVILERHNKPVAVLEDPKRFEALRETLEEAADILLALEAKRRESGVSKSSYIPLEDIERRLR